MPFVRVRSGSVVTKMTIASQVYFKNSSSWFHLLDLIYPVGSIYFAYTSTAPGSRFGGTWSAITGRFIYANAGTATGGSNTHTLTTAQMPKHRHGVIGYDTGGSDYSTNAELSFTYHTTMKGWWGTTTEAGSGQAHNNMPAYQTVYCWRRTA